MKTLFTWFTVVGLALTAWVASGCGGSWGCDKRTSANACIQYNGSQWQGSQKATYEAACTSASGTVTTACPSSGIVGRCTIGSGTAAEQVMIYYTGANVSTAQSVCTSTSGGTWSSS